MIKDKSSFNFTEVDQKQIEKENLKLDVNKASQNSDIPIKVLKENSDIFSNFLCNSFNNSITLSTFLEIQKKCRITSWYKKVKKISKKTTDEWAFFVTYQKLLKNARLDKCHKFLRIYFRNNQCGFREGFSTQQCLLAMLEKW